MLVKVQTLIDDVIKKGGGIRPYETLATLCVNKEGAKFYQSVKTRG